VVSIIGVSAGAFAVYLEPWHADVFDWLELRKNHGKVMYHAFCILPNCASVIIWLFKHLFFLDV
jgi:hypothetical protein